MTTSVARTAEWGLQESGADDDPPSIPAGWLDDLVLASASLELEDGERRVVERFVWAMSRALPDCGVAIALATDAGPSRTEWLARSPNDHLPRRLMASEGRLFPGLRSERHLDYTNETPSFWLAVGGDDAEAGLDGHRVSLYLDRIALALRTRLRIAAALQEKKREAIRLVEQVIQSEKLSTLGQLAAGLVHDLNNPLTAILGYCQHLRDKANRHGTDPADLEKLRRIAEAAAQIQRLSRDFTAYARPSPERTPVALPIHSAIDQALLFCEHILSDSGVSVARDYAPTNPQILGIGDQLVQVFVNLVTNACHAMQGGGSLSIRTRVDAARSRVEVRMGDTGHGIPNEHLEKIFEPYFTTRREQAGTGLGLSIVRNIMRLHHGSVRAESAEGRGATFVLTAPAHGDGVGPKP